MKKIILRFWISIRRACGVKSLRRRLLRDRREQLAVSSQVLAAVAAMNEDSRRSLDAVWTQLADIAEQMADLSQKVSALSSEFESRSSVLQARLRADANERSRRLTELAGALAETGSKADVAALSGQLLRIAEAVDRVGGDLRAIDDSQSLILVNQVMALADNAIAKSEAPPR